MNDALIYVLVIMTIGAIVLIYRTMKVEYEMIAGDLRFVLEIVDFVCTKFDFKYRQHIIDVVKYTNEAIKFIEAYDNNYSFESKKIFICEKAVSLLSERNIIVDQDTIDIIDTTIDYFYGKVVKM